jgi:hypothetical protein
MDREKEDLMQKHLFIIIMVSATVVVGGGLLYWGYSVGESIQTDAMTTRNQLSMELTALKRGDAVNPRTIDAERTWRDGILAALTEVTTENVAWNHRSYSVPKLLTASSQGQERESLPALPYNASLWNDNEWAYQYVQVYHNTLDRLVKELNATTKPTDLEILDAAKDQQGDLDRQREADAKQRALDGTDAAPARGARYATKTASPHTSRYAAIRDLAERQARHGVKVKLSDEALHLAFEKIRVGQTLRGSIYATSDSFDVPFEREVMLTNIAPQLVWDTWLGLCVQTDIAKAISMTNRARKGNTVLVAPIKRLLWVKIDSKTPIVKPESNRGRDRDRRRDSRDEYDDAGSSRGGDSNLPKGSLTEHQTSSVYTVLKYRFSVIMRTRDLPLLMEELLKTNYHVVVNQRIASKEDDLQTSGDQAASARGGADTARSSEKRNYYYGPEPVRQVMLECQLVLFNDWIRGTYIRGSRKSLGHWDPALPPLMPNEVLWTVPKKSMRPEDTGRMNKKKAYAWPNAAAAKEMSSDG